VSPSSGSSAFTMVAAPKPGAQRREESVWQFLERSSQPEVAATRAQWDGWLSRMPSGPREVLIRRLQDRSDEQVHAALAELVTFILLGSVYPAVEVDPETGSGSRTDFAVNVPVRTHIEVHRPAPAKASAADARRKGDIAGALERIESPDFWLDVVTCSQVSRSRLCAGSGSKSRAGSPAPRRHAGQAAPSNSDLLRQATGEGLSPPLELQRLTAQTKYEPEPRFERR
jgi:hypothetical protein